MDNPSVESGTAAGNCVRGGGKVMGYIAKVAQRHVADGTVKNSHVQGVIIFAEAWRVCSCCRLEWVSPAFR